MRKKKKKKKKKKEEEEDFGGETGSCSLIARTNVCSVNKGPTGRDAAGSIHRLNKG